MFFSRLFLMVFSATALFAATAAHADTALDIGMKPAINQNNTLTLNVGTPGATTLAMNESLALPLADTIPSAMPAVPVALSNSLMPSQPASTQATPADNAVPARTNAAPPKVPGAAAAQPAPGGASNLSLAIAPALQQSDLWQRIRNGYAMPEMDSPLVARHENWYAARPDYMAHMMERAQRYLYFITNEVEKRGMPTEIALLPMIESAFNPGAFSIGNAAGLWQFIPSTGKNFGLQQNWWYDGRRDIISATRGALDYLQKLHDEFGDWELALAAYNYGEKGVERAIAKNRSRGLPTDYESLKLPQETRNYVPKLLAIKNIVNAPEKFGLTLPAMPNQPYFTAVNTGRHIDVKLAAKLADISVEEFTALNPAHTRPVILQEHDDVLLLPVDKADTFKNNLENCNEPLVSWQAYRSKRGERLDRVAPRFGLSVATLRSVNGLSPRAKVSNGQQLLVPVNANTEEADSDFEEFNMHLAPTEPTRGRTLTHTVKKGETLASISHHYHVSMNRLQSWNDNITQVKPGQHLTIVQGGRSRRHHVRLASAKGKKVAHKRRMRVAER